MLLVPRAPGHFLTESCLSVLYAPIPEDDAGRLAALHALALLDTPREERFDGITRLAASVFDMPIALVSLVDTNRQWFKSRCGLEAQQTPRDISFCGHAIALTQPLIVHDAHLDERFADNPLVTGPPYVRFYAGAPIHGPGGEALGTLCLIDSRARQFSAKDCAALLGLSRVVEHQIAQRPSLRSSAPSTAAALAPYRYERLVQALDVGIVWVQAGGRINFCNCRARQLLNQPSGPLNALPWSNLDAVDASGRPLTPEQLPCAAALSNGEGSQARTIGVPDSNGATRWLKLHEDVVREGEVTVSVLCSIVDVTTEVRTEQQRAAHQARYRALFESSGTPLMVASSEGRVEAMNLAASRFFAVRAQDCIGDKAARFFPLADNRETNVLQLDDAAAPSSPRRVIARSSEHRTVPVELTVSPLEGAERVLLSIRDLGEELSAEQLKHDFVSMVSHELRTPLTSIRGSLGLLLGGALGEVPEQQRAMLQISLGSTERLIRLINNLLDIEKLQQQAGALQLERCELNGLLEQSIANSGEYARQFGVQIDNQLTTDELWVDVDVDRLEQVMANLLSNAVKFTDTGTKVNLITRRCPRGARIEVEDQGPGVNPELAQRLFQRFCQGDASSTRSRGGTGLGLSISKAIVEQFHGTIGFEPRDGVGTTFWVELPLAPAAGDEKRDNRDSSSGGAQPLPSLAPRDPSRRPQILYVEDDAGLVSVVSQDLRAIADLTAAGTLARARELYSTQAFDLVLLDLGLPDGDGRQLLQEVRQSQIVIFSARRASLPPGVQVDGWVVKTKASLEQLKTEVRNALRRRRSLSKRVEQ